MKEPGRQCSALGMEEESPPAEETQQPPEAVCWAGVGTVKEE